MTTAPAIAVKSIILARISDELNMTGKLITITEINMRIENCLLCITNLDNDNLGFKESNFNHPFTLGAHS